MSSFNFLRSGKQLVSDLFRWRPCPLLQQSGVGCTAFAAPGPLLYWGADRTAGRQLPNPTGRTAARPLWLFPWTARPPAACPTDPAANRRPAVPRKPRACQRQSYSSAAASDIPTCSTAVAQSDYSHTASAAASLAAQVDDAESDGHGVHVIGGGPNQWVRLRDLLI